MQYGICIGKFDKNKLLYIKNLGFDYVEINFRNLNALSNEKFDLAINAVKEVGLPVFSANCMLPPSYKITQVGFNISEALNFLKGGFVRASKLGIKKVVFGSGGARKISKNMAKEKGYLMVIDFIKEVAKLALEYGITIVIEPLAPFETNLINTVEQSVKFAADTTAPNVKAHADYFHMVHAKDDIQNIISLKGKIAHSHISNPKTRMFPKHAFEADYKNYINNLNDCGCDTCSVEGLAILFNSAAKKAIELLKSL